MNSEVAKEELRVVVVDDSEFSRKSIVSILEKEGIKVVGEAENAEKAISLLSNSNANLFIVDVVMPKISGIEIAKIIMEKSKGAHIMMVSSLASENIVLESISTGAIDFLEKPFERDDLISSVRKIEKLIIDEKKF